MSEIRQRILEARFLAAHRSLAGLPRSILLRPANALMLNVSGPVSEPFRAAAAPCGTVIAF